MSQLVEECCMLLMAEKLLKNWTTWDVYCPVNDVHQLVQDFIPQQNDLQSSNLINRAALTSVKMQSCPFEGN